jgi:hypothetical protein
MQRNSALPPRCTLSNGGVTYTCNGVATTSLSSALASPPALLAEQRYIPESSGVTASITRIGPKSRVRGPGRTDTGSAPDCIVYHLQHKSSVISLRTSVMTGRTQYQVYRTERNSRGGDTGFISAPGNNTLTEGFHGFPQSLEASN